MSRYAVKSKCEMGTIDLRGQKTWGSKPAHRHDVRVVDTERV